MTEPLDLEAIKRVAKFVAPADAKAHFGALIAEVERLRPMEEALRDLVLLAVDDPRPGSSAKLVPRGAFELAAALSSENTKEEE